jgi:hypothetical protein
MSGLMSTRLVLDVSALARRLGKNGKSETAMQVYADRLDLTSATHLQTEQFSFPAVALGLLHMA